MDQTKPKKIKVIIKHADREDVCHILNLLLEHFEYVYACLFGNNLTLTREIMGRVLVINDGYHALGYRSFHLAFTQNTGECVGLLLIDQNANYSKINRTIVFFDFVFIVTSRMGIFGLIRNLVNLKKAITATPMNYHKELTITYIAVSNQYHNRGIGKQLLDFVYALAASDQKNFIGLEIRETNKVAHGFFKKYGFFDDTLIRSDSDLLFGRGIRIHMRLAIVERQPVL